MRFKIESEYELSSDWLPSKCFTQIYKDSSAAVATAIEGVDNPEEQEVRVVNIDTGEVVFRTTDFDYE